MRFSERSGLEREPNPVSLALARMLERGPNPLDLTRSNPTRVGIRYDGDGIRRVLGHARALDHRPDPRGALIARQAICEDWSEIGVHLSPDQVLVTASTSEAYCYVLKLLCDPGDELLVMAPSYPLMEHLARFEGVLAIPVPLAFDGAWHLDLPAIRARIGPRTRAIAIVNPNNPTGNFLKYAELEALAAIGLPLISDEVFARYAIRAPRTAVRSALGVPGVLVFALGGLSKLCGLPQLKLSWIGLSGPAAWLDEGIERLGLISDAYLSASAPVMLAVPELLPLSKPVRQQIQDRLERNLGTLERTLQDRPVTVRPIEGGWSAVLRLPNTRLDEAWALDLLSKRQVLVQPGYFYDFSEGSCAVLSLLTPEFDFAEGVARIAEELAGA